ncbi:Argininosuccinate lyase [invertebrate metagenome]|uniref:Argininosuccinate lyase n=1 Tax=invertebrate metagenome TaxID=1711999 RepID=A0A484HD30_9ZZZZ
MTDYQSEAPRNPIWGGRFSASPTEIMARINLSIDFDKRLHTQDIRASRTHCAMLMAQGIISSEDGIGILRGLEQIAQEISDGRFIFRTTFEDIHMNVEARLAELIGSAAAGRLHTARSRNDQVATDFRLWVRDAIDNIDQAQVRLQTSLLDQAERHAATVMPGFTHLQAAQPITFGHHLMAYVEMIGRDRSRLADTRRRLNECPLGAAALAGTSFPIDRHRTAMELGFDRPCVNSIDAVSDRDFAIEFLSDAVLCAIHLSRLAEELVLWSSIAFRFIKLSDGFTTGSSIMPQKRNPDAAELVRAKSGRVIGALHSLLVVMKGLPLAYVKDMQEDKEPVFEAADTLVLCLIAMAGMITDMQVNTDSMRAACVAGDLTATDLADWLVRVVRMPFRQAHYVTGCLVLLAEERGCALTTLPLADMQTVEPSITADVYQVLSVDNSVTSRTSFGGTSPLNVLSAVSDARNRFL